MSSTLRWLLPALFIASGALPTCNLTAQAPAALSRSTRIPVAKTAEDLLYASLIETFANTEALLQNVTGMTDAQRDQVEALEAGAREGFFRRAQSLRDVRRTVMRGWPADPDTYEGPLNTLVEEQQRLYADISSVLTSTQRQQLARHVLAQARDRGFHVWNRYMKGYATAGSVNPAFQPF